METTMLYIYRVTTRIHSFIPSSPEASLRALRGTRGSLRALRVEGLTMLAVCVVALRITWAPTVCEIMAFMAVILGLGLLFHILLGFRYGLGCYHGNNV